MSVNLLKLPLSPGSKVFGKTLLSLQFPVGLDASQSQGVSETFYEQFIFYFAESPSPEPIVERLVEVFAPVERLGDWRASIVQVGLT